jgi:LmbE family N-acetylglucosaminyl deacetylase
MTAGMARDRIAETPSHDGIAVRLERRLVVVSPHLDDGVFSCGEAIAESPGALVVTVFAGRPARYPALTPWDAASGFEDGDDVVSARRDEDRRAARVLGAATAWLPFCDRQYGPPEPASVVARVLRRVIEAARPTCVMIPLGLFHEDHALTHAAALLVRQDLSRLRWVGYEDAIYRQIPGIRDARLHALRAAGVPLRPLAPIGRGARLRKLEAVRCYESQLRAMASPVGLGDSDVHEPERYWALG